MRLSPWDIVAIIAYTLVFALLEYLVIWLVVVLLSIVLPKRWFRERFVAVGTMIVQLTSSWAILAHLNDEALAQWSARDSVLGFGLYLVSLGVFYTLVFRFDRLERWIISFADRLFILAYLYLSGRSVYSVDAKSSPRQRPLTKGTVALLKDRYKLIQYFGFDGFEDQYELFDLSNDPEELENLYEASNPDAAELGQEIHARLQEVNRPWERQQKAS